MGSGAQPSVCQSAVPVATSRRRRWCPYQATTCRCQAVWPAASVVASRRSHSLGWRGPFCGLTPGVLAGRTGGGSYSWALSTRREISRTRATPQTWAAPLAPGFSFHHHDVRDYYFNPGGSADVLPFPVESAAFSLVTAVSVFTHLTE